MLLSISRRAKLERGGGTKSRQLLGKREQCMLNVATKASEGDLFSISNAQETRPYMQFLAFLSSADPRSALSKKSKASFLCHSPSLEVLTSHVSLSNSSMSPKPRTLDDGKEPQEGQ